MWAQARAGQNVTDPGEEEKPSLDLVNEHFALVGGRKEQFTANNGTCWFPGSPKSSPHSPQGQGPATVIALP